MPSVPVGSLSVPFGSLLFPSVVFGSLQLQSNSGSQEKVTTRTERAEAVTGLLLALFDLPNANFGSCLRKPIQHRHGTFNNINIEAGISAFGSFHVSNIAECVIQMAGLCFFMHTASDVGKVSQSKAFFRQPMVILHGMQAEMVRSLSLPLSSRYPRVLNTSD